MAGKFFAQVRQQWMGGLALLLVLTGGTAYAANTVFSTDIVDGEVKGPDLASNVVGTGKIGNNQVFSDDVRDDTLNGGGLAAADLGVGSVGTSEVADSSLTGADVAFNALSGADIDDSTLEGGVSGSRDETGGCDPSSTTFVTCNSFVLDFYEGGAGGSGTSDALVLGRVEWHSNAGGAAGQCKFTLSGGTEVDRISIGETTDTTDSDHREQAMLIVPLSAVPGNSVTVTLSCNETEADLVVNTAKLFVFGEAV